MHNLIEAVSCIMLNSQLACMRMHSHLVYNAIIIVIEIRAYSDLLSDKIRADKAVCIF